MAHTKGKWVVNTVQINPDVRGAYVYVEREKTEFVQKNPDVCEVFAIGDDGRPGGEMEANARLIAAAPELLEACKKTIEQAGLSLDSPCYMALRDAITKAEGKKAER